MTTAEYAQWAGVAISLLTLAYVVLNDRRKVSSAQLASKADAQVVAAVAGKVDIVEDRVLRIETNMQHLPDIGTTHRLEVSMLKLEAQVGQLNERMQPVSAMASRIQEALIERVSAGQ